LVKCTECLDAYKTGDANSCPQGTKLFSPRSRTDWETFFASTTGIAAPQFIVDVTRPENGCGGCTSHAMNSDNAEQASWVTSDGSAWWLRDATYGEPNGDYTANCYLALSTSFDGSNMNFNDGNCNYHSKSYFCQPSAMNLTPKDGSPEGCVCEEVTLTGTYSPGYLLKCTGCTDVYKSNDANSCPEGTKIFSPRSREDWQTIFESGGPLRSPHWIIDITRESSGGSYTSYVMNSDVSQVAAWKTDDASAWWLRSTTYSEPNGDYTADCYLDLWHASQDNADNVQWNDGSCSYHSNAYYCQPRSD